MTIELAPPNLAHNFAAQWHQLTASDPNHRGDPAVDLAFWQAHATGYDQSATQTGHYENSLAEIIKHTRPTDTLLDAGAGSGRYALPLAQHVDGVTALDHAAPMLNILREKMAQQSVSNIAIIEDDFDSCDIQPHDVVLAAWSLYRSADILASIKKLIAATRRTLIIITSPGKADLYEPETPMHLYFYGVMWQAGLQPDLKIIYENPSNPTPVAMLIWHRPQPDDNHLEDGYHLNGGSNR